MFRPRRSPSLLPARILGALLVLAGFAWPAGYVQAATTAPARQKLIAYRGYTFKVPASWPVIDLGQHPGTCVRFDLHAVYLGTPGANENCPSWLLGSTEALLIQPGPRRVRRRSTENPVSHQIAAAAARISVTGTFDTDPTVIYRALASAGLPAPSIVVPNPGRLAASASGAGSAAQALAVSSSRAGASPDGRFGVASPALPATIANDVGIGFDVCAAPSARYMSAWLRDSPYRAVGIYIGGSDRACDQANLTPAWLRQQAAAGWRFIPMYAGPQASFGQLKDPASQGTAAARDAAVQAEKLGLGPRTPVYYDMEAYPAADGLPALRFLSAWTRELHDLGYRSGVYSSSDSAIRNLADQYKSGTFAMPDVIYDALWNGSRNTADGAYRPGEWTGGRRLHQYSGDVLQTFGGDTMNIDQDYLDVTLFAAGGTTQATPGAIQSRGQTAVFYQGPGHRLWEESRQGKGGWIRTDLGGYLSSAPTVVQVNAGELDVFYRGRDGMLWQRKQAGNGWQKARAIALMGALGGAPRAVAQPNGVIDVFWKGSNDDHLWHGQYSPGEGWTGPENLHGSLASGPYPVETRSGQVQVFWKGTNRDLWHVVRRVGTPFSLPADLGMGPLGGPPDAVALPDGEIDVFWQGLTRPHAIWAAELRGGHVHGPMRRGGVIVGQPWPVDAAGVERVLYRGRLGHLWSLARSSRGRWGQPAEVSRAKALRSQPFAAGGSAWAPLEVFWTGADGRLWTAAMPRPGRWRRPVDLGVMVR